jgi:hypothetical protein
LQDQAEAGRKLKVNEQHKQQIKRRIEAITTVWRKRRRICVDFLIAMEDNTTDMEGLSATAEDPLL